MLVETARLWADLGFYATNGEEVFHIHGVTGPDEYTTVVNDNFYTNVMARFNLRYAARVVDSLQEWDRDAYDALARRVNLHEEELKRWVQASDSVYLPYDEALGINPQDDTFLSLEPWDFANTPPDKYPLLLHFHPLVIYRHQVLKQADVVLAMALRSDQFPLDQKRRNFDYYDPITTGDSSLSACVQAMAAAQIGYDETGRRVLPRGAVRRPRRHPRQRRRRRARRVVRWRAGARSRSGSPACSTAGPRCGSRRACRRGGRASRSTCNGTARACAWRSTPTGAPSRSSTGTRCRSRARTAPSCASTSASATASPGSRFLTSSA